MLAHMSRRLVQQPTFEAAVQSILDDVIALHGAEYGNVQLPIGDELALVAHRGLSAPFLRTFRHVKQSDGCACGRALRLGAPVLVSDIEKDPEYAKFRKAARLAGYRAVQSTPMMRKDGMLVGMVSTLFANVYRPTRIEMEILAEYGVIAAERLVDLVGHTALASKAEQMSRALLASIEKGGTSGYRGREERF